MEIRVGSTISHSVYGLGIVLERSHSGVYVRFLDLNRMVDCTTDYKGRLWVHITRLNAVEGMAKVLYED